MEQYIKIDQYGDIYYYRDREMTVLHREDGPAIEMFSGSKTWSRDGKLHRLDGPAVECYDGYKEWWLDGVRLSEGDFKAKTCPAPCAGKVIEIGGVRYRLEAI